MQGSVPTEERLAGGHRFALLTVFAAVVPTMRVAQEEILEPVAWFGGVEGSGSDQDTQWRR